jgi:hypothetical protein
MTIKSKGSEIILLYHTLRVYKWLVNSYSDWKLIFGNFLKLLRYSQSADINFKNNILDTYLTILDIVQNVAIYLSIL